MELTSVLWCLSGGNYNIFFQDFTESIPDIKFSNVVMVASPLSAAHVLENMRKFMKEKHLVSVSNVVSHSIYCLFKSNNA